jgi:hypothetical protein
MPLLRQLGTVAMLHGCAALSTADLTSGLVGYWHFFKYLDDPAESKALDNMGGANKGLFDVLGKPYQLLLDRARAVNREAYPLIEFLDGRKR